MFSYINVLVKLRRTDFRGIPGKCPVFSLGEAFIKTLILTTLMPSKNERLRIGTALVSHLSEAFYETNARVLEEYISNAADALATQIKIKITSSWLELADDGEGMTPDELTRFFYISHSEKKAGELRERVLGNRRRLSRQTIGQFGLGKLSAYRLADRLSIKTWRDGTLSQATLSFSELRSNQFFDDFKLNVSSTSTALKDSGTIVEMTGLKKRIYVKPLMEKLSERMFLNSGLRVFINEDEVVPVEFKGKKEEVLENHPKLGEIRGSLIYTDEPIYGKAGVYIRVYGRMVNLSPSLVHTLDNVSGAMSLAQRTILDINVDSMASALLANRNGFNEEDELYKELVEWVKKYLNKKNPTQIEERKRDNETIQEATVLLNLKRRLSPELGQVYRSSLMQRKRKKDRKEVLKEAVQVLSEKEKLSLSFEGRRFYFDLKPLGENQLAWQLDSEGEIAINTEHALFKEAKARKAQDIHSLNIAIVAIAVTSSRNLEEFKEKYEELTRIAAKSAR